MGEDPHTRDDPLIGTLFEVRSRKRAVACEAAAVRSEREELWEINAGWWQDGFTDGADVEYVEQIIPMMVERIGGAQRVLDVGTGEGQLARISAGLGAYAVGVDPTWAQIEVASSKGGPPGYARAEAAALPFADGDRKSVV